MTPSHVLNDSDSIVLAVMLALPDGFSPQERLLIHEQLCAVAAGTRYEEDSFWLSSIAFLWRSKAPEQARTLATAWDGRPDTEEDHVHFTLLDPHGKQLVRWEGAPAAWLLELGTLGWRAEGSAYGPSALAQFDEEHAREDEPCAGGGQEPSRWLRWRRTAHRIGRLARLPAR